MSEKVQDVTAGYANIYAVVRMPATVRLILMTNEMIGKAGEVFRRQGSLPWIRESNTLTSHGDLQ